MLEKIIRQLGKKQKGEGLGGGDKRETKADADANEVGLQGLEHKVLNSKGAQRM